MGFFDLGGDCEWRLCALFSGLTTLLLTVQTLVGEELYGPKYAFVLAVAALEKYALG